VDYSSGSSSRTGRPLELAGRGRLHAAKVGARPCCGPAPAVGAPLRCGSADARTRSPGGFVAFGGAGHASEGAETLRQVAWEAQRPPLRSGETLPGDQEGRLKVREEDERRGFAIDIKLIAKPFMVKTQAKSSNDARDTVENVHSKTTGAVQEAASAAQQAAGAAQQSAQKAAEATSTAQQVSVTVKEVADNAAAAADSSRRATDVAQQLSNTAQQLVKGGNAHTPQNDN
jgi:hypothetical protein